MPLVRNQHRRLGLATLLLLAAFAGCGSGNASTSGQVGQKPAEVKPAKQTETDRSARDGFSSQAEATPKPSASKIVAVGANARVRDDAGNVDSPTFKAKSDEPANANQRYLIVHADDVGMCRSVNRATIDAMERGLVSSASIMVPCPAFEEFAEYAREHPDGDYGVHLTLNAEFESYRWGPVLPVREVPGLVDRRGYLWREQQETVTHARTNEVERELTAQIERALEFGVPLSHLDTHMGTLFTRPEFTEIYVNLGIKYDLPILFTRSARSIRQFPLSPQVRANTDEIIKTLDKHRLPVLEDLCMHYVADNQRRKRKFYLDAFRQLPPGVSEVIVHCGYDDRELRSITRRVGLREGDRLLFMDPSFDDEVAGLGIEIITWKQFREMNSKKEKASAEPLSD